ncbi:MULTISPECIES: SRPBCC domain-containing protein [Paenibacillus]|uniref:SRPBCC domain-containing protein n=1 Tax=Paenibacillus TaxID=44249 RepID=UPI0004F8099C|nr:SRPBCC domain-containing protein [Paenibacillus odorifer]AIQ74114.1 ATPase [Paenibacillus odorifer]OMC94650.1 ATPase [Paenibacillus odorifer]OME60350.1 ATPase [Paenibacillus odorifer]OZQ76773.1 ATPase [Paenibacillus odorifer]
MTNSNPSNQVVSKIVDGNTLVLERVFQAPRELVFKAFSEAEHLKHWWGPKGWTLPVCNVDFRPGGTWHYCMKCEDKNQGDFYGMESWGKALYKEITVPEQVIYTDGFSDAEGNISKDLPETLVQLDFIDLDGQTKLVNTGKYSSPEALQQVIDMGMLEGISQTFDNLDAHLENLQKNN